MLRSSVIIFLVVFFPLQKSLAVKNCPTTFDATLDRQLRALDERDLDTYMSTLPMHQDQLVILPDGNTWSSRDEIEQGHKEWFEDETWVFNREVIRKDVRDTWGLVVYRVSVDRPDFPGKPFLLSMMYATEQDGCWYLQHDQNTLLPEETSN